MLYASNVGTGCGDIDGSCVLLEHLPGCIHSPHANGKGKAVTKFVTLAVRYFQALFHGCAVCIAEALSLYTIAPLLFCPIQSHIGLLQKVVDSLARMPFGDANTDSNAQLCGTYY